MITDFYDLLLLEMFGGECVMWLESDQQVVAMFGVVIRVITAMFGVVIIHHRNVWCCDQGDHRGDGQAVAKQLPMWSSPKGLINSVATIYKGLHFWLCTLHFTFYTLQALLMIPLYEQQLKILLCGEPLTKLAAGASSLRNNLPVLRQVGLDFNVYASQQCNDQSPNSFITNSPLQQNSFNCDFRT